MINLVSKRRDRRRRTAKVVAKRVAFIRENYGYDPIKPGIFKKQVAGGCPSKRCYMCKGRKYNQEIRARDARRIAELEATFPADAYDFSVIYYDFII